jgi:endonuclease/exonuclease/phosphatase family metal-dependent hydrolase
VIRLVTYNIRHASLKGLDAIVDVLLPLGADLVALQEVDRGVLRSGRADQAAALAAALGMEAAFAPAMEYQGGHSGVALLSRHPIASVRVHPLPSPLEPRVALEAIVERQGGPWQVVVTHLGLQPSERFDQVQALMELASPSDRSLLFGDLNEGRTERAFGLRLKRWVDCLGEAGPIPLVTYPASHPVIGIDHVLRSGDLPRAVAARTLDTQASDHLPVVVDLG